MGGHRYPTGSSGLSVGSESVIWLLEEPESYLHPALYGSAVKLMDRLRQNSLAVVALGSDGNVFGVSGDIDREEESGAAVGQVDGRHVVGRLVHHIWGHVADQSATGTDSAGVSLYETQCGSRGRK